MFFDYLIIGLAQKLAELTVGVHFSPPPLNLNTTKIDDFPPQKIHRGGGLKWTPTVNALLHQKYAKMDIHEDLWGNI